MAEIVIQRNNGRRPYRARSARTVEIDHHDILDRFGIELEDVNGQTVIVYLSRLEAIGLSAKLRSEIADIEQRREVQWQSAHVVTELPAGSMRRSGSGSRDIRSSVS